ncbi:MAG: TIM44-like domain-containing protein [Steroidobacteraceae bacterium]|jgi:predicted lipid-binding transport protein (Tim44 family)
MRRSARAATLGAAGATLSAAGAAFGRAGGGGHAGSSGHSSSGAHSSSHSGSGGSVDGLVGLLVVALIVYFFIRRSSRGSPVGSMAPTQPMQSAAIPAALAVLGTALGGPVARRGSGTSLDDAAALGVRAAADEIRARDPGFELEVFLQRAEMIFFLVKRGIQQNDAAAVRPYVGDRVFAAVAGGIAQAKSSHQHALLESLNVRAVHVDSATCDESGQRIVIHFDLVYRAQMRNDSNQVIADEGSDQRHGERWTFARSATARTADNGGVAASRCPACGAELRLNLDGTCAHCRASVTNGSVDWVVVDVQGAPFIGYAAGSSFAVAAATVEEGAANLRGTDPSFSIDAFQTRAKTAFLVLQDAWCKQNLDAGRAFLSPGAYFTWRAQLEALAADGRRNVMENVSVERIDPVQIVHGRVFDDLTVRVTASAADFEVDKDNRIVFGDRTVRSFTEDWTFQRSVGVATTNKPGTLENTCPSCGAPIALNQIGECRYCRAAVTSGKFDWVVSRIEQDEAGGQEGDGPGGFGRDVALQVGGAIVGGLLASLLSDRGSDHSGDWS